MLPGTERNVNTGVLMLWNVMLGNITHVLFCLGTLYTPLHHARLLTKVRQLDAHLRAKNKIYEA